VGNNPILTGLGALPGLTGYVATTPKPTGQMVLISHKDDPVLAVWQYGLGRVVAWTSDALGLWTANWLQWNAAARWWANLVTWTLPTPDSSLNVNATITGGSGHLTVDLPPGTAVGPGSQQQVQAKIITPDLSQETVTLQPTAPHRWEGNFPTIQVGAYVLQVTWQGASSRLGTTTGLVVPYSPEFHTLGTDVGFLTLLAHAGGGALLGPGEIAAAFASNVQPVSAAIPITFWLLALAALLLPIDIAARRLASLEFLVMGYKWLTSRVQLRKPQRAIQSAHIQDSVVSSTALGSLRAKREEWRSRAVSAGPQVSSRVEPKARPAANQEQSPTTAAKTEKQAPDVSVASKLLEAKRQREQARSGKKE